MQNYELLTHRDFINLFKEDMSVPQFQHFQSRISGILNGAVHGSEIARGYSEKHETSERRFLSESKWDHETVNQSRISLIQSLQSHNPEKYIAVPLDDTVSKKYGNNLPGIGYHWSNTEKKTVWSQCLVTTHIVIDDIDYPLFSNVYDKDSNISKLDLAVDQIIKCPNFAGSIIVIIGDTWYSASKIIGAALGNNYHYLGMIKKNRLIKPENINIWMSISDIASRLRKDAFHLVTVKGVRYRFAQVTGSIKGFTGKKFKVLIAQQRLKNERRWSKCYYLLTTDLTMTAKQIVELYRKRWTIETFYKFCKERLGLSKSRVLGKQALSRFVILLFFGYTYLSLARHKQSSFYKSISTLYEAQRTVYQDEKGFLIEKIYTLFQQGASITNIKIKLRFK